MQALAPAPVPVHLPSLLLLSAPVLPLSLLATVRIPASSHLLQDPEWLKAFDDTEAMTSPWQYVEEDPVITT